MDNIPYTLDEKVARPYQLRLFDHAVKHNSIIYLPTGSGKTYIAIMIIRHFSKNYMLPIGEGGKRCAVLCNTVALARQLVHEIAAATNFKVALFIGDLNVDNWPQEKWKSEINANQILVGTSQVFVDMTSHNHLSITDLSCVIIDECHHATKSHPMHQFLSLFMYAPQSELPRVVGLTGILLKSSKKTDILGPLDDLETIFRGTIITVENLDELYNVLIYSTSPKESLLQYVNISPTFDVELVVEKIIKDTMLEISTWNLGETKQNYSKNMQKLQEPNKIKQTNSILSDFVYQMKDMGVYAASVAIMGLIVQFEVNRRNTEVLLLKNMYRYLLTQCDLIRHILVKKLKSYSEANDEEDDDDASEANVILNFSKPKLQSLLSYFHKEFSTKKASDISCLLFVQRRYTAKCLCFVIKNFAAACKGLSHISADFMVGRNACIMYSIDSLLDTKWDRKAIDRFRRKECNLIVCSSVLEEGIDVQACNYVISFDPIKQFGSYVQMKGRARSVESTFLVVCETAEVSNVLQKIKHYKEIDQRLKNYLLTRTIDREVPEKSHTNQEFSEKIKPFISPTGAILQAESALALMFRYCQTLPHDSFTSLNPIWKIISAELGNWQLSLQLPLQSTVKDVIYSDVVRTCKDAKVSCAFKACLNLYEKGELNDDLLPVTKKQIVENVSDIYFAKWKDQANVDCSLEGSKKNQQIYEIFWPKEISPNMPVAGRCSYAYRLKTFPNFEKSDTNKEIFEMLTSESNYAIVCSNKLPAFAHMPMYVTQGQLTVEMSNTPMEVTIRDEEEINLLKKFTKMIFHDIRKFWQDFLTLNDGNQPNSFLIAPTKSSGAIDWDLVRQFQRLNPVREPSEAERAHKVYRPEDYIGKVVCTWYNDCEDGPRYVVTKIFNDLTPLSPFPDDTGSMGRPYTFADYVESKYGRRVMHRNQFMIEVRPINKRTRFFVNISENAESKKQKRMNKIVLIPEMCHNFNYPGDLWLKALLLPSILHRLYYLQCAEWLRIDINKFLGIPSPPNYSPAPLQIDYSLARVNVGKDPDSPRSLLPALENMRIDEISAPSALVDVEQGNWKQHYEPIDVYRNANSVYPIEIDYFYMFVNNLLQDMESLSIKEVSEDQISTCNLKAYQPKTEQRYETSTKRIKYSTEEAGYRLELLEKTATALTTAEQYEFLAAITTSAANDLFDMERFEVLGDSFLKFSISLLLMNRHPTWNEGFLTATKSKMVSNRNFLYCMRSKFKSSFIRTSNFDAKDEWLPPMSGIPPNVLDAIEQKQISLNSIIKLHLSDNEKESGFCFPDTLKEEFQNLSISDEPDDAMNVFFFKQTVRDKVMADCLEALIGVCVKNYGVEKSFQMIDYFGIYYDKEGDLLPKLLKNMMVNPRVKTNISQKDIDGYLPNYQFLEENLKYKFQDRAYLLQALTHPSYPTNRLTGCYQQLEFIGDAVLDFLISSFIYESCTHMTPGEITDLRSALVNNITLACICIRNHFHQFMLYESPALAESIRKFVEFQIVQDHRVTDQVKILLEEISSPESFNMAQNIDVPKTLGDIVEAIIGAVFIDSGNDLKQTWNVIYGLMRIEINDFVIDVPIDPVRRLCEYRGANPSFSLYRVEIDVVMVECTFHCRDLVKTVIGCGANQVMAKKAAAKMALQILNKN